MRTEVAHKLWAAYYYGMENSTDQSTKLGAILVCDGWNIAQGCNHHMRGFGNLPDHHERPFKYAVTEHAERDAIFKALSDPRVSAHVSRSTLFAPWVACPDCARAIVLSGIREVVCHRECMLRTPDSWKQSIDTGMDIMCRGGVHVEVWSGRIRGIEHLMNGEIWHP